MASSELTPAIVAAVIKIASNKRRYHGKWMPQLQWIDLVKQIDNSIGEVEEKQFKRAINTQQNYIDGHAEHFHSSLIKYFHCKFTKKLLGCISFH